METPEIESETGESDLELLSAYRSGDLASFSALYERHRRGLAVYAAALTNDRDEAEDLVHEAFLRLPRYDVTRPGDAVSGFLYTVVRNLARDRAKKVAVQRRGLTRLLAPTASGERERSLIEAALDEMERLPDEQRETLALKVFGGMTFAQIAEISGVAVATAASRYRYAIEKLAQRLGEDP